MNDKQSHWNWTAKVGAKVQALRSARAMSQEALGLQCGLYRSYISRIENGRANPTLAILVDLALALGVEPYELLQ